MKTPTKIRHIKIEVPEVPKILAHTTTGNGERLAYREIDPPMVFGYQIGRGWFIAQTGHKSLPVGDHISTDHMKSICHQILSIITSREMAAKEEEADVKVVEGNTDNDNGETDSTAEREGRSE